MSKKKFVNKAKEFKKSIGQDIKCHICGKERADVKLRKLYDYINCEDDWVMCCSDCEAKFWEEL